MNKKIQILKTALKLFSESGIYETATSKIAREADVATGTLFHYYKTKDELIISLNRFVKIQLSEYLDQMTEPILSYKSTLKNRYVNSISWAQRNAEAFNFIQQFNNIPYYHQRVSDDEMNEELIFELEDGVNQNVLKPISTDLLLLLFNNHLSAVIQHLFKKDFSEEQTSEIIYETFELLWSVISIH